MADTVDINISQTVETVDIIVTPNLVTVNINQITGGGGGDTNLGYTPSPTNGIVTSDTGTDATIPLADATNAGLLTPAEKIKIENSVPYTGANTNVDLGTHSITVKDLIVNHSSGSGDAATITKGGSGEALKVVKTSGSGNAASITGGVTLLDELHLNTDLADTYIASASVWNAKQDALVSATNIKTINGSSILGSGDLNVNLDSLSDVIITSPIADQVLVYDGLGDFRNGLLLTSSISNFNQSTRAQVEAELLAGTNITITPSGTGATRQLTIASSGGGSSPQSAYSILANNTNANAIPTEQPFENLTNQVYNGTIVWTGGSAPSGTTEHTYSLSQVGNLVTLIVNLSYGTAGAGSLTSVAFELPSTAPSPYLPTSVSNAGHVINYGSGTMTATKFIQSTLLSFCALRIKSTGVYEIAITRSAGTYINAYATIQYFV